MLATWGIEKIFPNRKIPIGLQIYIYIFISILDIDFFYSSLSDYPIIQFIVVLIFTVILIHSPRQFPRVHKLRVDRCRGEFNALRVSQKWPSRFTLHIRQGSWEEVNDHPGQRFRWPRDLYNRIRNVPTGEACVKISQMHPECSDSPLRMLFFIQPWSASLSLPKPSVWGPRYPPVGNIRCSSPFSRVSSKRDWEKDGLISAFSTSETRRI